MYTPAETIMKLFLFLLLLLFTSNDIVHAAKKSKKKTKIKSTNKRQHNTPMYSLRMGVQHGEETTQVMEDINKLLAYSKSEKIATPLQILLRTAHQKLTQAVKSNKKKVAADKARKLAQEKKFGKERSNESEENDGPKFTEGKRQSKELKAKAPVCNMLEYKSKADLQAAFEAGTVPLEAPFIVRNAVDTFSELQETLSSDNLRSKKFKSIGIKYYEPKIARVMMQQGGKGGQGSEAKIMGKDEEGGQAMEVFDPQMVDFTEFFAKCFSKNKRPGPDTEHCEQEINALRLGKDVMGKYELSGFKKVGYRQEMDTNIYNNLYTSIEDGSLLKLFDNNQDMLDMFIEGMEKQSSRSIVFGPSGSGSSMAQIGMPFADALVHGRRRWFILTPQAYIKLKKSAGDDFQPGSAFSFFEDMYAELKEEFGMKIGIKHGIYECNQGPGDIVYIPAGLVRTSLTLADSISYKQELLLSMEQVSQYVDARVWFPRRQTWNAAMCYSPLETWNKKGTMKKKQASEKKLRKMVNSLSQKLGGMSELGMDPQQLVGAFDQQIATRAAKMSLLVPVVLTCKSVEQFKSSGSSNGVTSIGDVTQQHRCVNIRNDCDNKLLEHAKQMKTKIKWLEQPTDGTDEKKKIEL